MHINVNSLVEEGKGLVGRELLAQEPLYHY